MKSQTQVHILAEYRQPYTCPQGGGRFHTLAS